MATQRWAANGEMLTHYLRVDDDLLTRLGIKYNPLVSASEYVPKGLIGFDIETGLAIVKLTPDSKCIQVKIGKFLKKLGKTTEEINEIGCNANKLKQMSKMELQFTQSGEEVVDVYRRGPASCMKGCDSVSVYEGNDVAVAYLEYNNEVVARSVVCKNEDIGLKYVRAYGLVDVLEAKLEEAGYMSGSLDGCSIPLKETPDGSFVMPYLDGAANEVTNEGDHFLVSLYGGDFTADNTSGTVGLEPCCSCGELVHREDMCYSEYLDESMCECCYDQAHVFINGYSYHIESGDVTVLADGEYALSDEAVYVDDRDEYYHESDCVYNVASHEHHLRDDLEFEESEEGETLWVENHDEHYPAELCVWNSCTRTHHLRSDLGL